MKLIPFSFLYFFHQRNKMPTKRKITIGDRVIGKTKKLKGRKGKVVYVNGHGVNRKQKRYDVLFDGDDEKESHLTSRSIDVDETYDRKTPQQVAVAFQAAGLILRIHPYYCDIYPYMYIPFNCSLNSLVAYLFFCFMCTLLGGGEAGAKVAAGLGAVLASPPKPVINSSSSRSSSSSSSSSQQQSPQQLSMELGSSGEDSQGDSDEEGKENGGEGEAGVGDIPDEKIPALLNVDEDNSEEQISSQASSLQSEQNDHGAAQEDPAADPDLTAHGLTWTVQDAITMDERRDPVRLPVLNFHMNQIPDFEKFHVMFMLLFPQPLIVSGVTFTSKNLHKKYLSTSEPALAAAISSLELTKWVGITLAKTLYQDVGRDLWKTDVSEESCRQAPRFGSRFGMTRKRYDAISSCLAFGEWNTEELAADPWLPIQTVIDAFNTCRETVLSPGTNILLDEIMSSWLGSEAKYSMGGVPHKTKIIRKPKGVGVELKALIDCKSSIMMRLELCEGAKRQALKKYENEYGAGTAVSLRLTEPWHGKGHVVIGDSAFSSVSSCVAFIERGTFFRGIVKTASKLYPKKYMNKHEFKDRGDHLALSTTVKGHKIHAVSWLDSTRKDLVSTCGTTLESSPLLRHRQEIAVSRAEGVFTRPITKETRRCEMVSAFFDNFHWIDVHDHLRQGVLALEQHWLTKNWVMRLFATILGVIATDCFYASKFTHPDEMKNMSLLDYIDRLAFQLINYEQHTARMTRSSGSDSSSQVQPSAPSGHHELGNISELERYTKKKSTKKNKKNYRARIRCSEPSCDRQTVYYCVTCTGTGARRPVGLCSPTNGSSCYFTHIMRENN